MNLKVLELFLLDGEIETLDSWNPDQIQHTQIQVCFRLEDEQLVQITVRCGKDDAFVWVNRAIWFHSQGSLCYSTVKKEMVVFPIPKPEVLKLNKRLMQNPRLDLPDEPTF